LDAVPFFVKKEQLNIIERVENQEQK